jgi:hypothetical protein
MSNAQAARRTPSHKKIEVRSQKSEVRSPPNPEPRTPNPEPQTAALSRLETGGRSQSHFNRHLLAIREETRIVPS